MSKAIRLQSSQYPFEVRLRARELFLKGRTLVQTSEEIGREQDERNALEAKAKGLPAPPPVARIPQTVLSYWSKKGSWAAQRQVSERHVEREQLKRIRKEMASEVQGNTKLLGFLQGYLQQYFLKKRLDAEGKEIKGPDGKVLMEPRGPADWPMDSPVQAISLMFTLVDKKASHLRLVSELLGESVPKIEPSEFTFNTGSVPPLPAAASEKEK